MIARPHSSEPNEHRTARALPRSGLHWWLLGGLLPGGLALGLRLYQLGSQSLWLDEGSSWQMIQQGWGRLLLELFQPFAAYPLYHLLLKGWVTLAGDSEAMLRLPSALAGALAVPAILAAGLALRQLAGDDRADWRRELFPLTAALLALASPFAIWYAQEAKVYSLLLLWATLLLWSVARALRPDRATFRSQGTHPSIRPPFRWRSTTGYSGCLQALFDRRDWLIVGGLLLLGLFMHRLAVLLLPAVAAAWLSLHWARIGRQARRKIGLGIGLLGGLVVLAMAFGLGSDQASTGAYIAADPLTALYLTFLRFSLDRGPGEAPWWWLLPWALLALWGPATALWAAWQNRPAARVLLAFLLLPLLLFLLQLNFTRLYEARYLMVIYPAWLFLLAYPLLELRRRGLQAAYGLLLLAALSAGGLALIQPQLGIFSGDPVKEQYRSAMRELAQRLHPDDLVVLHPSYLQPLYDYYLPRMSADPAPQPVSFGNFQRGQVQFGQREWDEQRREAFSGYTRSWLLIAPEHARTVDIPLDGDKYGLVGLYFQYSWEQRAWPCGLWGYVGVDLLCQAAPEAYYTGEVPAPETKYPAAFGEHLRLLGFTLKATTEQGPGVYRAGGTLPITLFWDVTETPPEDYSMFLHLCRDCEQPPAAGSDGPPLAGYLPTSIWLPGNPARDDRTIALPADLPPGEYTLLIGVYPPGESDPAARLPADGAQLLPNERLVLGSVEIIGPASSDE